VNGWTFWTSFHAVGLLVCLWERLEAVDCTHFFLNFQYFYSIFQNFATLVEGKSVTWLFYYTMDYADSNQV